jgi:hypothetical protein
MCLNDTLSRLRRLRGSLVQDGPTKWGPSSSDPVQLYTAHEADYFFLENDQ